MNQSATHHMYYVAILCPPETDEKILQFKHWMKDRFNCVVALKSPAHITLIQPFWLEESREPELLQTFRSFTSDSDEMNIGLDGFSHFTNRVLFVNVKEDHSLDEIKKQVEIHFINSFGDVIKKDDRAFHPHITIANRDLKPNDFLKAWEHFSKKDFTTTFRTRTVSLLKLTPARWTVIEQKYW